MKKIKKYYFSEIYIPLIRIIDKRINHNHRANRNRYSFCSNRLRDVTQKNSISIPDADKSNTGNTKNSCGFGLQNMFFILVRNNIVSSIFLHEPVVINCCGKSI